LIKAGCFDRLEPERSRPELIYTAMEHEYQKSNTNTITRVQGETSERPKFRALMHRDRVRMEYECFGFPISEHPLDEYEWYLEGKTIKAKDIPHYTDKRVNLAGLYVTRKAIRTRQGDHMEFLTLEDQTALVECVLFPDVYEKYNDLIRWESLFVLQGIVECAYGVHTITVQKMAGIDQSIRKWKKRNPQAARQSKSSR